MARHCDRFLSQRRSIGILQEGTCTVCGEDHGCPLLLQLWEQGALFHIRVQLDSWYVSRGYS